MNRTQLFSPNASQDSLSPAEEGAERYAAPSTTILLLRSFRREWIVTGVALLGIGLAIVYVLVANPEPAVSIPVTAPAAVPFHRYLGAAGVTEPNSENIAIGTSVPGIVSDIYVQKGDIVKKGQPLFLIDDREAQSALHEAQAGVEQATAELRNAEERYAIAQRLDERTISRDERNQRHRLVEIARARLKIAEAAAEKGATFLELHTVRAPMDGTIMTSSIRVGEYAPTGILSEPLLRFGNLDPMHLRVDIDENDAWRLQDDAPAIAYMRGNPQIQVALEFVRIEPYVRPKVSLTGDPVERVDTRVLQVIYRFKPGALPIYAGQQMDVYIEEVGDVRG